MITVGAIVHNEFSAIGKSPEPLKKTLIVSSSKSLPCDLGLLKNME
jgi:hypothetical protein